MTDIKEKVSHVRKAKKTGRHPCHWPSCNRDVPPAMWGCKKHWFRLPKNLRDAIWLTYRPGQEIDKNPSGEYMEVAFEVQRWITENAHD